MYRTVRAKKNSGDELKFGQTVNSQYTVAVTILRLIMLFHLSSTILGA